MPNYVDMNKLTMYASQLKQLINTKYTELSKSISKLENDIESIADIEIIEDTSALRKKVDDNYNELDGRIDDIQEEIDGIDISSINDVKAQVDTNTNNINNINNEILDIDNNISRVNNNISNINNEISSLNNIVNDINIDGLQSQINTNTNNISSVTSRVSGIENELDNMATEESISDIRDQLDIIESDIDKLSPASNLVIITNNNIGDITAGSPNSIFEIHGNVNLNGDITVPTNSTLRFVGDGHMYNGTVNGNHTNIEILSGKAFDDETVTLKGFKFIDTNWFLGDGGKDLTNIINNHAGSDDSDDVILYIHAGDYTCNTNNTVLKNVTIKGAGKNDTNVVLNYAAGSKFCFGFGYGTKIKDISLKITNPDSYTGFDVLRLSNDFLTSPYAGTGWAIENISIEAGWVEDNGSFDVYNANGIGIYCKDINDNGGYNESRSMSYCRDFRNIRLIYFKRGINIYVAQETDTESLSNKKIWCNSFLFNDLEIWAHRGIMFMIGGKYIDYDTGYFTFNNYMYQGRADGCGYYTNMGMYNMLCNYISWDTDIIGHVGGGYLNVSSIVLGDLNKWEYSADNCYIRGNIINEPGRVIPGVSESTLYYKDKHAMAIYTSWDKEIFRSQYILQPLNVDNNILEASKTYFNDNACSGWDKVSSLVENIVTFEDTSTGDTIETMLISKPLFYGDTMVCHQPHNIITIKANWERTIPAGSNNIHFIARDEKGDKTNAWALSNIDGVSVELLGYESNNVINKISLDGYAICEDGTGYLYITNNKALSKLSVIFTISGALKRSAIDQTKILRTRIRRIAFEMT